MQSYAQVVVVGGGVMGANILYSLAKRGWKEILLLERKELTSGSTWHAAGLVPVYSFSYSFGRVIAKSIEVYENLERETNQAIGWHKCGQLRVARTSDRMDEYLNYASIAETQGVRAEVVDAQRVCELWPFLEDSGTLIGGVYNPDDGYILPADITQALAKEARNLGAGIHNGIQVNGFEMLQNGEWKVLTDQGSITCEHVVTASGNYARQTGAMVGLDLPAMPILHQYWVTDSVQELAERHAQGEPELPVLRDEIINGYIREERDGFNFGPYEVPERLELFAANGVPAGYNGDLFSEDFEAVEENWKRAMELVPVLERAGIKSNVRGPICTTPDNLPLIGPAPGLRNFWLAEGVAGGFVMGSGLGHFLAEWIDEGEPSIDMSEVDVRRFGPYSSKSWAAIKIKEAFGNNFGTHYPGYEWPAGRPLKTPPCYERLTAEGAVWGSVYGWEIPNWFAPSGIRAKDKYSYRRANFFEHVGNEARAVREAAGLLEMTPMTKFEVSGSGAETWLERILANKVPRTPGRIALCHLLTHKGTVCAEFTVTRLDSDLFYLVATPAGDRHDYDVLKRLCPTDGSVRLRNATLERGVLTVVGPKARDILQPLTETDLSNEEFPWLTARTETVGFAPDVRMLRVNYEGELGWELYHPLCYQLHLLDEILKAGHAHGLCLFGNRAVQSLRLEKSYRAMYREMNVEYTALESGLDRFIRLDKGDFLGRDALVHQQQTGLSKQLVTLAVDVVDAEAHMNEGIYKDDTLVGRVTSGAHSYTFDYGLSLGYVSTEVANPGTELLVRVLDSWCKAIVIPDSPYDRENHRLRA